MATSTNYGWAEPDNSSLVKNGASDIRTLGNAIDTSVWNVGFGQAGKNKIINGNFGVWQRGTSGFTFGGGFNADRFQMYADGTGVTRAITQQTFTPATAPVAGYEGTYYLRYAQTVAGTGGTLNRFYQKVEDVRVFAGQTIALSFWAKADAARSITANLTQNFGSGGSTQVSTAFTGTASVTTSWQRFTFTVAAPSLSGKTIGTSSYLEVDIDLPLNVVQTIDIWGVQLELGTIATPFQTASGGSPQAELAMCQRYFTRYNADGGFCPYAIAETSTTTIAYAVLPFVVSMRSVPSATFSAAGTFALGSGGSNFTATAISGSTQSAKALQIQITTAGVMIAGRAARLTDFSGVANGSNIDLSAEL
jgi:hypothetical protein